MGGGLMQLVAYGAQDVYLTGNPQITFWKVTYRRHTNFAMESIEQTFNGQADFGRRVQCTVSRNGDLAYRTYLQITLPEINQDDNANGSVYARWLDCPGEQLISMVEVEIGGQRIDRQYGHWHSVWSQLTEKNATGSNTTLFNRMTGNGIGANDQLGSVNGWTFDDTAHTGTGKFWIPLYFWFCRNPGLALPLIALQYH